MCGQCCMHCCQTGLVAGWNGSTENAVFRAGLLRALLCAQLCTGVLQGHAVACDRARCLNPAILPACAAVLGHCAGQPARDAVDAAGGPAARPAPAAARHRRCAPGGAGPGTLCSSASCCCADSCGWCCCLLDERMQTCEKLAVSMLHRCSCGKSDAEQRGSACTGASSWACGT